KRRGSACHGQDEQSDYKQPKRYEDDGVIGFFCLASRQSHGVVQYVCHHTLLLVAPTFVPVVQTPSYGRHSSSVAEPLSLDRRVVPDLRFEFQCVGQGPERM